MLTVLITGKFRRPDVLQKTLETVRLLSESQIVKGLVVSTWEADAAQFRSALSGMDAEIVISREPRIELPIPGHVLHQRISLRDGLEACSEGLVLRLRSDAWISAELVRRILHAQADPRIASAIPLFKHKVWVPWIDYEEPFHVADEMLLGHRDDLRHLARHDIQPLIEYGFPLINVHTLGFLPDSSTFPRVYFDFLAAQRDSGVTFNDATSAKFAKLALSESCPAFQTMLGIWYRTIQDNFLCFSEPSEIAFFPGGTEPAIYYRERKPLPAGPDRLFDDAAAGFFNHFYLWNIDDFSRSLNSLNSQRFARLLSAMTDPAPHIADHSDRNVVSLSALMKRIKTDVPPGRLPDPGLRTRLRRTSRRILQGALRAVG